MLEKQLTQMLCGSAKNQLEQLRRDIALCQVLTLLASGYRLIYSWASEREEIYLLRAYAKGQKADLTKGETEALLQVLADTFTWEGKASAAPRSDPEEAPVPGK